MSTNQRRDADMDRLLRAVLKPESHAQAGACPDPDLLAAFVEGSVSGLERESLDGHIARCGRCQETLAVLAREVPGQETAATGVRWFTWVSRPRLRWLVPITAVATVAAFFVATRSLIAPGGLTPDAEVTQFARAAPPPPSSQFDEESARRDKSIPPPAEQEAESASRQQAGARPSDRARVPKQQADAASVPVAAGRAELERQAAAEAAVMLQARAEADEKRAKPSAEPAAPQLAAAPVPTGAAMPVEAGAKLAAADAAREASLPAPRREEIRNLRAGPTVVESPGGAVRWRLAAAGQIWRSADAGSTWHPQASGVSADLFAGAAPSSATCWAVGAAGTVLLAQDGERWERRRFPLEVDLTAIEARNTRVATVTTRDGRRFVTLDGGATWSPRQ